MMRSVYTVVGLLLTPLLRLWLGRRVGRGKEDAARLDERFGYPSAERPAGKLVWLHAASVGETQSVLTLVRGLLAQHATLNLLITTGTVTSAALVARENLPRTLHQYVPVDTLPAALRFLTHWRPDLVLWVESELWPQLLFQVADRQIPLLLINARMSEDSLRGWQRFPRTIRRLLHCFTAIYAGSGSDAAHFATLGAEAVRNIGNLKYDADPLPVDNALLTTLSTQCDGRPVWVAASTHPGEEEMIAAAHAQAAKQIPGLLLILIPRHAVRGDAIAAGLRAQGITLAQRSKAEPVTAETSLYLADTMGELGSFYRVAELVFLGGSLMPIGGHNPLEPARLSCALLTGPHLHNFATIMQHFQTRGGIRLVPDSDALAREVVALLTDDAARLAMAEHAMAVVQESRGASVPILNHCALLLMEKLP